MSYTMLDWFGDLAANDDVPQPNRPHHTCYRIIVDAMREDRRMIVRISDMEALVRFAEATGLDHRNDDQWLGEDAPDDVLMALANWAKERRDWEAS